jgi:hypothetical protein
MTPEADRYEEYFSDFPYCRMSTRWHRRSRANSGATGPKSDHAVHPGPPPCRNTAERRAQIDVVIDDPVGLGEGALGHGVGFVGCHVRINSGRGPNADISGSAQLNGSVVSALAMANDLKANEG